MIENRKVLAVIPARGGSKGIPHKNIALLAGKPLINYSIEGALACKYIDSVVVSTDDDEIAKVAEKCGARVPFRRPKEISDDNAKTADAVEHAIVWLENYGEKFDIVVLLQPTQPCRTVEDINRALETFVQRGGDGGLVSVSPIRDHPILIRKLNEENGTLIPLLHQKSTVRRQDFDKYYRVDGSIYINWRDDYKNKVSLNDNLLAFVQKNSQIIDVDTYEDLKLAEWWISQINEAH